jgi:hypothetical protein
MSTSPDDTPAGATAVMDVSLLTVKLPTATVPNFTTVAPARLLPVMVTTWPPARLPVAGKTAVTDGSGFPCGKTKV